jgi:hypothetical protein
MLDIEFGHGEVMGEGVPADRGNKVQEQDYQAKDSKQ